MNNLFGTYTYTVTAQADADVTKTATITILVHGPDLMGSGTTATGIDVLYLAGHYGSHDTTADLDGSGSVDDADLNLLLTSLGW